MSLWRTVSAVSAGLALTVAIVLTLRTMLVRNPTPHTSLAAISVTPPASELDQVGPLPNVQPAGEQDPAAPQPAGFQPRWVPAESEPERGSENPLWSPHEMPPLPASSATASAPAPPPTLTPAELQPAAQPAPRELPVITRLPATTETSNGQRESVYVARAADSLWSISEQRYGTGGYYMALFLHNRGKIPAPDRIAAGLVIETPPAEELRRLYPERSPSP